MDKETKLIFIVVVAFFAAFDVGYSAWHSFQLTQRQLVLQEQANAEAAHRKDLEDARLRAGQAKEAARQARRNQASEALKKQRKDLDREYQDWKQSADEAERQRQSGEVRQLEQRQYEEQQQQTPPSQNAPGP